MKNLAALIILCLLPSAAARATETKKPAKSKPKNSISKATEEKRKNELLRQLSERAGAEKREKIGKIFSDKRLTLYIPSTPPQPPKEPPEKPPKGNPYLAPKYGLTAPIALERGRVYNIEHKNSLDLAEERYDVNRWDIIGHLRIETRIGATTEKDKHPLGSIPVVVSLYSLYVRQPKPKTKAFALEQLKCLIDIAEELGPDLYEIKGSATGAFGYGQFEPCSYIAYGEDGNGDGKIDMFNFDDTNVSIAKYLRLHRYDRNDPKKRFRAICSYYGNPDKNWNYRKSVQYYAEAVIKYAEAVRVYRIRKAIEEFFISYSQ